MERPFDQPSSSLTTNPQPGNLRVFRPTTDPLLGQHMGSYRLTRLLGSGGGANIYLGEHRFVKATYAAIKIPKDHFNDQEIRQFCKEASTLFRLVHPHIIRVVDFGVEGVTPYLVMDYAPNGSLRERYPKGARVPLETILTYVKHIASALQYAHDERIVHRDIKPENLLVGKQGQVLLADFGIAAVMTHTRSMSGEAVAGTATYMAPEQFRGKACPASDQYALGIVVYEWLCGQPPFRGTDAFEIAFQHVEKPLPTLHLLLPGVPPAVEQVVQRALTKNPAERFPSVQDFATALEEAIRPAPVPSVDSQGASLALVPVALASAHPDAPGHPSLWRSAYWLNLGFGLLVTGVVAIVLSGTIPLSPGSIVGGILMGVGGVMAWVGARFT